MLYDTSYYNMGDVTEQHADLFIGGSQQASPVTSEQQAYQLSLQSVHQQNTSPNTQQTVFTVSFFMLFLLRWLTQCVFVCGSHWLLKRHFVVYIRNEGHLPWVSDQVSVGCSGGSPCPRN